MAFDQRRLYIRWGERMGKKIREDISGIVCRQIIRRQNAISKQRSRWKTLRKGIGEIRSLSLNVSLGTGTSVTVAWRKMRTDCMPCLPARTSMLWRSLGGVCGRHDRGLWVLFQFSPRQAVLNRPFSPETDRFPAGFFFLFLLSSDIAVFRDSLTFCWKPIENMV